MGETSSPCHGLAAVSQANLDNESCKLSFVDNDIVSNGSVKEDFSYKFGGNEKLIAPGSGNTSFSEYLLSGAILVPHSLAKEVRQILYDKKLFKSFPPKILPFQHVDFLESTAPWQCGDGSGWLIYFLSNAGARVFIHDGCDELRSLLRTGSIFFQEGLRSGIQFDARFSVSLIPRIKSNPNLVLPALKTFSFVELFAGIGGFHVGLQRLGGHCVLASEIDTFAQRVYQRNFPGTRLVGNIYDLNRKDLPMASPDLLVGGFPCQSFSISGKMKGFGDENGVLFFELARVIQMCQPRALLLENVPHLLEIDHAWKTVETTLHEIGYTFVHKKVINAKYVVPQSRSRLYIVAFRQKPPVDFTFPDLEETDASTSFREYTFPVVRDILESDNCGRKFEDGDDYVLSDSLWNKVQAHNSFRGKHDEEFTSRLVDLPGSARTLIGQYRNVASTGQSQFVPVANSTKPRYFTPRECARLQGFPESFTFDKIGGHAGKTIYKQFGNAVVPPIICGLGVAVLKSLEIESLIKHDSAFDAAVEMAAEARP